MINIDLVESLRTQHGYSQEQMAKLLGYESRTAYNTKVKGKREFSINDLVAICKIFQLKPNDLIIL